MVINTTIWEKNPIQSSTGAACKSIFLPNNVGVRRYRTRNCLGISPERGNVIIIVTALKNARKRPAEDAIMKNISDCSLTKPEIRRKDSSVWDATRRWREWAVERERKKKKERGRERREEEKEEKEEEDGELYRLPRRIRKEPFESWIPTWKWLNPTTWHHLPPSENVFYRGIFFLLLGNLFIYLFLFVPLPPPSPPPLLHTSLPLSAPPPPPPTSPPLKWCHWIGSVLLRDAMDTASSSRCFRLGERWTIGWVFRAAGYNHVRTMIVPTV